MYDGHEQVEGGEQGKQRWTAGVHMHTSVGAAPAVVTTGVGAVVAGATPRTNKGQHERVQTSRLGDAS